MPKTKDQLLEEAAQLLDRAYSHLVKDRLLGEGGNTRYPHETRMFARHFSPDSRGGDASLDEFATGWGTYQQWMDDYKGLEKKHCVWHGRYKAFCNECKRVNGEPRLT